MNDGEDSKELSESQEEDKKEKVTKSGHVRVNSVDLDDVEMDGDIATNV